MPYALELPLSGRLVLLPDCWQDVTLAQADALQHTQDLYDTLAILCGVAPEHVMQWPAAVLTDELQEALSFLQVPMPELTGLPVPSHLVLPGTGKYGLVSLPLPQDISAHSFGQAADLGAVLSDASLSPFQQHARVLAIYFYSAYYRCAYDSDGVDAFAAICSQATLAEALPLTAFFLGSTSASGKPMPSSSSGFRSRLRSARRAWTSWCSSGIRWPSWMRWPVATKRVGRISSASRGPK